MQVPLIDRKYFFGNPVISGSKLSPDGQYISFMREVNGIMNIWVKSVTQPFEEAHPLTDSDRPLYGYFWTDDSKYILYLKDKDGDENINIFSVSPHGHNAIDDLPVSTNLTPLEGVRAEIYKVSDINPDLIFVGINERDPAWHDLFQLEISTQRLTKMYENTHRITSFIFDWDDDLRLATTSDEVGNSAILQWSDEGDFVTIFETNVKENANIVGWTPDNQLAYLATNKGDVDLETLYSFDPQTGIITKIESDPEGKVDFGSISFDEKTREIIATYYLYDRLKRYFKNQEWKDLFTVFETRFPDREVDILGHSKDNAKFLIVAWGDKYLPDVYYYDTAVQIFEFQYTPRPDMKPYESYLASMHPITYPSSDGLMTSGYLTLPYGENKINLPLVILVHGGPKGPRDVWGYDGQVQFLANRGYAVLQPNFRASGGFGKNFLNAGDKQWGQLMQDDITYGAYHLTQSGVADKGRIAIMGGSYGGYATLAGLTFTPDLYTCGIDIVGPSNLFTLLESIPAYWESGRAWLYEMVGDPNTDEGKALLTKTSPLFHADNIIKPLLIIQGANDPRVKKAESDQIVNLLRSKNHDVKYLMAADEGHGFAKPLNKMAMYAAVEEFLAKHLRGNYDPSMPDDVSAAYSKLEA